VLDQKIRNVGYTGN